MSDKIKRKIGLLGGSFNPIHLGHTGIAREAAERLGLETVLFIPAGRPPHKSDGLAPAEDRLAMVRLAVEEEPGFEACDLELHRPGPSYTIDTVRAIRDQAGAECDLFFLIGADTLRELPSWRAVTELLGLCTFVALSRPGEMLDVPPEATARLGPEQAARLQANAIAIEGRDIAATDVRRRVAAGHPIGHLVAPTVAAYMTSHGLYRPSLSS